MSKLGWIVSVGVLFSIVACGDDDSAPPPPPRDGGGDGSMDASNCILCAAPPEGCRYEGGSCESCGVVVCDDGAVAPVDGGTEPFDANSTFLDACSRPLCPPPSPGCRYDGATECECGTLVCECGASECSGTQVCRFTTGCTGAGTCMTRPTECDDGTEPVCGCNGATYDNACSAAAAGVSVAADGPCPEVTDCREGECPFGERCLGCLAGGVVTFECLPNDVDC